MYDMTKITKRVFNLKFVDGRELHIFSPKLIAKNKIVELINENTLLSLSECAILILNNNEEKIAFTVDEIQKLLNEDELIDFIDQYTTWLTEELNSKNS